MISRIYLDNDWQFFEEFSEDQLKADCASEKSVIVRLPHTCKEIPFHYFDESLYQMVCSYRKVFKPESSWKNKHVLLTIDGAAHESEVFLNGKSLAVHHCGYTAYTVDLAEDLDFENDNVLVIKVNSREDLNVPPFGLVIDYMTYGGIYRDVYIDVKEDVYFKDIFLKPDYSIELDNFNLSSEFTLNKHEEKLTILQSISEHKSEKYTKISEFSVSSENSLASFDLKDLKKWSVDEPNLYDVKNELFRDGVKLDEKIITVGFRKAEFKKNGFFLNGRRLKIRGLDRHQSYPYVGYAMPQSMQVMDAKVLKNELGLNAVRTSHYPQSHYFIDACDELGLLVFTEIPGWQHIGDDAWKDQAVENVRDMVTQWRNHASIILWGVRINESKDDDDFYRRTNALAHHLDSTRPTGGVRAHRKSSLLEDVYTYNDFVHSGSNIGCLPKKKVTSDINKPYLVSEYNGHMFPTKNFDCEEHRRDHAIRHANVLDAIASYDDICGSFGWVMSDYNTHKDFGSGDRICYHGVLDMWRNPKMAASVYSSQQEKENVLEVGSSMDIGEHPACFRGATYIFTNADSVKMYKNDRFIKEYKASDSSYKHLAHGPLLIDDFIGDAIEKGERFSKGQAKSVKAVLNMAAVKGISMSGELLRHVFKLVFIYHMNPSSAVGYFNKYVGDWGGKSTSYRFEAIKDGKVVKTVRKGPMKKAHIETIVDHNNLKELNTYDVASVRFKICDENSNVLNYYSEPVKLSVRGPLEIIGPDVVSLHGGMFGTFVKTTGKSGDAVLTIESEQAGKVEVAFTIEIEYNNN